MVLGQFQPVLIADAIAAIGTFVIAFVLKSLGCSFKVNERQEGSGLDISQHGEEAYGEKIGSPTSILNWVYFDDLQDLFFINNSLRFSHKRIVFASIPKHLIQAKQCGGLGC